MLFDADLIVRRFSPSAILSFLAKLALTAGALAYIFYEIDLDQLTAILHTQDMACVVVVIALLLFQILIAGLRWRHIVHALASPEQPVALSRWAAFEMYYISIFFSCCLPGGLMSSDVVRVWLAKAHKIPLTLSIHSVVIDRIIALLALFILVVLFLPHLAQLVGFDARPFFFLAVVGVAIGVWCVLRLDRALARFSHIAIVSWLLHFMTGLRAVLLSPLRGIMIVSYSVSAHVIYSIAGYVLAKSMGITLSLSDAIMLIPPVILLMTMPISIGGWGAREIGFAGMLALVGVPKAAAVLLGVQLGILLIVTCLPAGILWLLARKKNHSAHDQPLHTEN
ncbi:MAG: UPF0104 family protein [Alphaproteobacteria bacterium]|nr:UPF0104 family protein [Alphaproteobacteria bacterium]